MSEEVKTEIKDFIGITLEYINKYPSLSFLWNISTVVSCSGFIYFIYYIYYYNCLIPFQQRVKKASETQDSKLTPSDGSPIDQFNNKENYIIDLNEQQQVVHLNEIENTFVRE